MRAILLLLLLPTVACDFDVQCGTTQGFVYGAITGATSSPVMVFAQGLTITDGEVATDGASYELNLEGGDLYTIWAEDGEGCRSPEQVVLVEECEEIEIDLAIDPLDCG